MAAEFRFGVVVRGQAEPGEDIARRFEETLSFVRLAHRLGYDSITKTAHYSPSPFQMLQLVPMLARFTAEAPGMRLNAGVLLLPLMSPLHVAEEFATLDVMSGGKNHPGCRAWLPRRRVQGIRRTASTARTAFRGQS